MKTEVHLTAAVLTHERPDRLHACATSILEQLPEDGELVVLENGSRRAAKEAARQMAATWPEAAWLAESETNLGVARGRQALADYAAHTTEAIAFFDDDTVLRPGCLQALRDLLDAEPNAGAVAAQVWENGRPVLLGRTVEDHGGTPTLVTNADSYPGGHDMRQRDLRWDAIHGGATMIRARLLQDGTIHFNTRLFIGHEDLDLSLQIRRAGRHLWSAAAAHVDHHPTPPGTSRYAKTRHDPQAREASKRQILETWGINL